MKKIDVFEPGEEDVFPGSSKRLLQPTAREGRREPAAAVAIEIPGFNSSPTDTGGVSVGAESEAIQLWKEQTNLDRFLEQLYQYYQGNGYEVILINRVTSLLNIGFVATFALFLRYCIKWDLLWQPVNETNRLKLAEVINMAGFFHMSFFMYICTALFAAIWIWQVWMLSNDIGRLKRMKSFFNKVLLVKDEDLKGTEFSLMVNKLIILQNMYPIVPGKLDACEIANRIMRRENYLIALFNKDIIDFSLPLPFGSSKVLTKSLEWNLSFAILSYIFDDDLVVKKSFLKDSSRKTMAEGLQKRFQLLALVNLALSPFIFVFLLLHFLFRYGEEMYKDPSVLGNRQYTPYARWKLREFNELPHIFDRRLRLSYKKANRYMEQFHSEKLASFGKFAAFISGSIFIVLLGITLINDDLLLNFEITPGKSVIWYLAVLGGILAMTRALVPDAKRSKDPVQLMNGIQEFTHYMPKHWKNNLMSQQVRDEFGELYQYQIVTFLYELSAVVWTPYMLWFNLTQKSANIVEFFREFTVHVDKIGYVCSFALFDFKRHGNPKYGSVMPSNTLTGKYLKSKQGKMEKSFISFAQNYPEWTPNELGSIYISRLRDFEMNQSMIAQPKEIKTRSPLMTSHMSVYKQESEDSIEANVGIMALLNEFYEYRQHNAAS